MIWLLWLPIALFLAIGFGLLSQGVVCEEIA